MQPIASSIDWLTNGLSAARMEDLRRFAMLLNEEERTRLVEALAPILIRPEIRALTIGTPC